MEAASTAVRFHSGQDFKFEHVEMTAEETADAEAVAAASDAVCKHEFIPLSLSHTMSLQRDLGKNNGRAISIFFFFFFFLIIFFLSFCFALLVLPA